MATAEILAQDSFSGVSGTLTLAAAVPDDGTLHVCWGSATVDAANWDNVFNSALTDSNAIPWTISTFVEPLIGEVEVDNSFVDPTPSPGSRTTLYVGSSARACTAGDLGIGDTVDITMDSDFPGDFSFSAMLVYIPAPFVAVDQVGWGSGAVYINGDYHFAGDYGDIGSGSPFADRLTWATDPFIAPPPQADTDAYVIALNGAYPAVGGFAPYVGSQLGEELGVVSIAVHVFSTGAGDFFDPGGVWPSDAFILAGNYQTQGQAAIETAFTVSQHFTPRH